MPGKYNTMKGDIICVRIQNAEIKGIVRGISPVWLDENLYSVVLRIDSYEVVGDCEFELFVDPGDEIDCFDGDILINYTKFERFVRLMS